MGARLWTALLLLGAVVLMHGLQCASADHTGATPLLSAVTAGHGKPTDPAVTTTAAAMPVAEHTAATPAPDAAGNAGTAAHGRSVTAPHNGAAHLWAICLAVLAAGLALLSTLAGLRLLRLGWAAARPAFTRAAGSLPTLRPPELFALCVLRI
ncbi:hypothetical protein SAMN05660662_1525 [Blastococcus aurantiacus]|uniref:Uncharacterized protein n=2 Tax=Blastococcus aurantiacus TaxID=1550231 RepID=A0A1G7JI72_9ACTN|nr:hypothetical protein SAMN05660662_1525 [Blastococcus aurantiacus]